VVRPELPTAAAGSSQAPAAAVDNSAPRSTHPESTYKSGKAVQTTGTTSRFTVSVHKANALEERFKNRRRLADRHDGFLGLEILKSGVREVTFILMTRWESRDKLKAYLRSQDFAEV